MATYNAAPWSQQPRPQKRRKHDEVGSGWYGVPVRDVHEEGLRLPPLSSLPIPRPDHFQHPEFLQHPEHLQHPDHFQLAPIRYHPTYIHPFLPYQHQAVPLDGQHLGFSAPPQEAHWPEGHMTYQSVSGDFLQPRYAEHTTWGEAPRAALASNNFGAVAAPRLGFHSRPPSRLATEFPTQQAQAQPGPPQNPPPTKQREIWAHAASSRTCRQDGDGVPRHEAQQIGSQAWRDQLDAIIEYYVPANGGLSQAEIDMAESEKQWARSREETERFRLLVAQREREREERRKAVQDYRHMIEIMPESERKYYPFNADMTYNENYAQCVHYDSLTSDEVDPHEDSEEEQEREQLASLETEKDAPTH